MKFRQQYADPEGDEALGRLDAIVCLESEDLAEQQWKDEVDINTMVRRFGITGELPQAKRLPYYGDFSTGHDFQSSLNALRQAEDAFMSLPSELRNRLGNDPARFIDYLNDEANAEEIYKLGLAERPATVEPIPVRVLVDETPSL